MKRFMHDLMIVVCIEKNRLIQLNVLNMVNQGGSMLTMQTKGKTDSWNSCMVLSINSTFQNIVSKY